MWVVFRKGADSTTALNLWSKIQGFEAAGTDSGFVL
jgi:hypothetical protein